VPMPSAGPAVDAGLLPVIAGACRDYEMLRFCYTGRKGEASARVVEPHRLAYTGRRWYLVAWDVRRRDWRTFRVDRMKPPLTTGARFTQRDPPDGDFAAYVARSVAYQPYVYRASVKLHAPADVVAERLPPAAGVVEPMDDRTCMLHTGSHSLDVLCVFLGLIGVDFEVQGQPELADHMRGLAARFDRAVARTQ
jgi:predicted DNA-binding transcriptional regulator YafY